MFVEDWWNKKKKKGVKISGLRRVKRWYLTCTYLHPKEEFSFLLWGKGVRGGGKGKGILLKFLFQVGPETDFAYVTGAISRISLQLNS